MLPRFSYAVDSNASQRMGSHFTLQGLPRRVPDWQAASSSGVVSLAEGVALISEERGCGVATLIAAGIGSAGCGLVAKGWSAVFGWGASGKSTAASGEEGGEEDTGEVEGSVAAKEIEVPAMRTAVSQTARNLAKLLRDRRIARILRLLCPGRRAPVTFHDGDFSQTFFVKKRSRRRR